jgi:hypothetical protein
MSVALGGSTFFPYVCAVYTCECGRRAVKHGADCGSVPSGWETLPAKAHGERGHVCEACRASSAGAGREAPRPAR